jgi:hypothetical protein
MSLTRTPFVQLAKEQGQHWMRNDRLGTLRNERHEQRSLIIAFFLV